MRQKDEALENAISAVGSSIELARRIGVSPQALSQWRKAPPLRVLDIEAATEGRVSRYELRPDIYPLPHKKGDAA